MKINYRKLEINDLGKIYNLGCESIKNNFISQLNWDIENISTLLSQDMSSSFVAHIKKKIVGFIIGKIEEDLKYCIVYWIGTEKKYEKYQIESNLLKFLKKEMELKKIQKIKIFIEKENVDLIEKISYVGFNKKNQLLVFE